MERVYEDVESNLNALRRLLRTDFAALASNIGNQQSMRWKYASGNRNERYKRIVLRSGRGYPGKVLRSGRPVVVESFLPTNGMNLCENTILLAEGLKSIICVPLTHGEQVTGVLLTGCRYNRLFEPDEIQLVLNLAEQITVILQKQLQD